jgi:hypothetical protein
MSSKEAAQARLRTALELAELAEQMMLQNLRRADPQATQDEIRRRLGEWLRHRPGAEAGDCPGKPVSIRRTA